MEERKNQPIGTEDRAPICLLMCLPWDVFKTRVLFRGSFEFNQSVIAVEKAKVCTCLTHCAVLLRNSMQSDGER